MNRREVLRKMSIMGIGATFVNACKGVTITASDPSVSSLDHTDCVLIPQEAAGPFPLDLSSDLSYFRRDIREGRVGLQLDVTLRVVNVNDNCAPISNARVDIWHCDVGGVYSGFANQTGGIDATGETFCRGIQLSDDNGDAKFTTVYPGWYPGRATHIHFQVFLNNGLVATSQLAFPESINTVVYNTSEYTTRGQNGTKNTTDVLFRSSSNSLQNQIASTTPSLTTGGFDASLKVGIAV